MTLLVIYNPACGDSAAEQFFNTHVVPRIRDAGRTPAEIIRTPPPGDAETELLRSFSKYKEEITIVLGSGDGTLHEIVNLLALSVAQASKDVQFLPIRFALVPCGTANALYSYLFKPTRLQDTATYKLQSLEAFLRASTSRPLILSLTSLHRSQDQSHSRSIASVVVTSTALHAAILRDSEKLRGEIPGIDRFKVAARQNITKWYASHVKLLPVPSSGLVYTYDAQKDDFIPLGDSNPAHSALDIHGPFAYFLSTVNVDRLEPEFRINPTISKNPPLDLSMDVIMVRPQRDPTFTLDTPQSREIFAEKLVVVLTAAYQDGNHINLRYSDDGSITESGNGNTVVESFRCGGWEWIPDNNDEDAHILCADGAIVEIEKGGQATSRVVSQADRSLRKFHIYV